MGFRSIKPNELKENIFSLLADRWSLITTGSGEKVNAMTASWGGLGVMWKKDVAYIVVRKSRYTLELLDKADVFSLAFFEKGKYRSELAYCGANSGRNVDKIEHCGFSIGYSADTAYIEQAEIVLLCRNLSRTPLEPGMFLDYSIEENYPTKDYHIMFIAEITDVLVKE